MVQKDFEGQFQESFSFIMVISGIFIDWNHGKWDGLAISNNKNNELNLIFIAII